MGSSAAESTGEEVVLEALSTSGGVAQGLEFELALGIGGQWTVISTLSKAAAPGFYLLTILETESISAKGCEVGSVNLRNGTIDNENVRSSQCIIGM